MASLYLAVGKIDTTIKVFRKKILLEINDLVELNARVQEKLCNHEIGGALTSVIVSFGKNRMSVFGVWSEFVATNLAISEVVESVTMTWDFLVKMPSHTQPQRHTLTVKIASDTGIASLLPAILSSNLKDVDRLEMEHSPVVCQVDFINHLLSEELISIVDRWVESRRSVPIDAGFIKWIQRHRRFFADMVSYTIPIFVTMVAVGILHYYVSSQIGVPLTAPSFAWAMNWSLISFVTVMGCARIANRVANYLYQAITEYGEFMTFNLTNGDRNRQQEINTKNKKRFGKFLLATVGSLVVNIVSAIICFKLFNI